jgi:translation initiation factor IF-3
VDDEGNQLGVIDRDQALRIAEERGLDLVEVAPNARPPVCRIMDFSKFKYRQSKSKKQKTHIVGVKEIRLRPKTEEHDLDVKIRKAREFLEKGHKVLVTMQLKCRERAHIDFAEQNVKAVIAALSDVAKIETPSRMAGRGMNLTLTPLKAAPETKE